MTIASAVCSSFKKELLQGYHDFDANGSGGDTFKIALYTSGATLNATTTDYSTNESILGAANRHLYSRYGVANPVTMPLSALTFTGLRLKLD